MANYITIRNSVQQATYDADPAPNTETGKRFKVVQGGLIPLLRKRQTMDDALDGTTDISVGSIKMSVKYTIRVPEAQPTTEDPLLGDKGDLDALFLLNDTSPAPGSPSNLVTIVDHLGESKDGFLVGDHSPQPLTTILTGEEAHYLIQIEFAVRDSIG